VACACDPSSPSTGESEVGGLLEPKCSRPGWAS
jgi:hypothetical protein